MNKLRDLHNLVYSSDCDILAVTETWLTPRVSDNELIPAGYSIHRLDRSNNKTGGGVLIAVKNSLPSTTYTTGVSAEIIGVNITLRQNYNVLFLCCYKPPNADNNVFIKNLNLVLSEAANKFSKICLLGDFNFPNIKWHDDGTPEPKSHHDISFCDALKNFSFLQMNTLPSTCHGNVLDLIFTNFTKSFDIHVDYDNEFCTDHRVLNFTLPIVSAPPKSATVRWKLNYKRANWVAIEKSLVTSELNQNVTEATNINEALSIWMESLNKVIEIHVPKTKIYGNNSPAWFDKECFKLRKYKDRLKRKAKKTDHPEDLSKYKKCRNRLKNL